MGPPVLDWDQRSPAASKTPPVNRQAGDRFNAFESFSNVVRLYSMPALPEGMLPNPSQTSESPHDAGYHLEPQENVNRRPRAERVLSEVAEVHQRYTKNINLTRKQQKVLIVSTDLFPEQGLLVRPVARCKK